jgi:hypothetical protein
MESTLSFPSHSVNLTTSNYYESNDYTIFHENPTTTKTVCKQNNISIKEEEPKDIQGNNFEGIVIPNLSQHEYRVEHRDVGVSTESRRE